MPNVIDMTGKTFGRLTVLCRAPRPQYYSTKAAFWLCRCTCGREVAVSGLALRNGLTRSCGCLLSETSRRSLTKNRLKRWTLKVGVSDGG